MNQRTQVSLLAFLWCTIVHLIPLKAETSGGGGNTFQWNSFSNIEEINEGFLKTVTKGWNNNLAQSAGYQLSSEFCISIDLTRVDWGNGSLFKIGLDPSDIENIEEAELLMTFGDYKLSIPDGGEGIEADLGESSVLQLEYHSGILKIFNEELDLIHSINASTWTVAKFYMAIYDQEAFIPISYSLCESSVSTGGPFPPASLFECSDLSNEKYIRTKTYSPDDDLIADGVEIQNNFGQVKQVQQKKFETDKILAKAVVFDRYGRPAIETFQAPLSGDVFCYDQNFITAPTAAAIEGSTEDVYDYNFFDLEQTTGSAQGEEYNPYPVSPYSTLGSYYSGSGTPHYSNTSFPYVRNHYTEDMLEELESTTGFNEVLRAGGGHEQLSFQTVSGSELDYVYGYLGSYMASEGSVLDNNNLKLFKSVVRDANGNTFINYTNSDDLVVASCKSGGSSPCIDQRSTFQLSEDVQSLIHVPASKSGTLQIRYPDPGGWYTNYTSNDTYCRACFDLKFYDKIRHKYLVEGVDYNIVFNSTTDNRLFDIDLLGVYDTEESFLGVSYSLTSNAETVFSDFMVFYWIDLDPEIIQELDYHDWQLNYYDPRGNLVKKVQPEGVNCDYDARTGYRSRGGVHFAGVNRTPGTTLYSMETPTISGNTSLFKMGVYVKGVYPYSPEYVFGDYKNEWYDVDPYTPAGGEEGGGSSGGSGESEGSGEFFYTNTMPSMHQVLCKPEDISENLPQYLSYGNGGGVLPTDPFGIPDSPPPSQYDYKLVSLMRYECTVQIMGVNSVGNKTLLAAYDVRIDQEDHKYLTIIQDTTTGEEWVEYFDDGRHITKMCKSYPTAGNCSLDNNNSLQDGLYAMVRDDLTLTESTLDQYERLEIRVVDLNKFSEPWRAGGPPTGLFSQYNDPESLKADLMQPYGNFNLMADFTYEFTSTAGTIQHKALQEEYTYDVQNRLVQTELPDEGVTQMVYATDGRLRFAQTAQQAADNEYSYINYDRARRPVEKGIYRSNPAQYPPGANLITMNFTLEPPTTAGALNVHDVKDQQDGVNDDNCFERHYFKYDTKAADIPTSVAANFTQHYLRGKVSKSWNDFAATWYSYNFDGTVEWVIMQTADLGVRTIRYHHDKLGKVIAMDYNEGDANDDLYVKYDYTDDQELTAVYASDDPLLHFKLMARYYYDELGNLTRKELGNSLQGVDLSYTSQGALKAMNNAHHPDKERGGDGLDYTSSFFTDLYAETLSYYDGDFEEEETWIQNSTAASRYDGLVKSVTWHHDPNIILSHDAGARPSYNFSYDSKGQLTGAVFGNTATGSLNASAGTTGSSPVFSGAANQNFKMDATYDGNGNISTLQRRAYGTSNLMDNLAYQYDISSGELQSNKLQYVTDAGSSSVWADEMNTQSSGNYTYDASGRLLKDMERDVYLTYNSLGLVSKVENAARTLTRQRNTYNERGQAITQKYYNSSGVLQRTVYRVYDASGRPLAEYEAGGAGTELKQNFVHGIEKVATLQHGGSEPDYQFEVKDHIGNVRATFHTEEQTIVHSDLINTRHVWNLRPNTTVSYTPNDNYLKLQGVDASGNTGMVKGFDVSPGKRYTMKVQINEMVQGGGVRVAILSQTNPGETFVYEDLYKAGWYELSFYNPSSTRVGIHVYIPPPLAVGVDHFVISEAELVSDELVVLSYTDYYPFGSPMPGRRYLSSGADAEHGYSGDYSRENDALQWNEFQYRNYDSRLGRWLSPDPARQYASPYVGMGNNPISVYDPTGLWGYYNECTGEYMWVNNVATDFFETDDGTVWSLVATSLKQMDEKAGVGNYDAQEATAHYNEDGKLIVDALNCSTPMELIDRVGVSLKGRTLSPELKGTLIAAGMSTAVLEGLTFEGAGTWLTRLLSATRTVGVAGVITAAASIVSSDSEKDKIRTLYRGVGVDHPGIIQAYNGVAIPRGGMATPAEHNRYNTRSMFTSWTSSRQVADWRANLAGNGGVVLKKSFRQSELIWSPDIFAEAEWLVFGIVTGAKVEKPNGPGAPHWYD